MFVLRCQSGALSINGFDKEKCFTWLQEEEKAYHELNQPGCGKLHHRSLYPDPAELEEVSVKSSATTIIQLQNR